MREVLDTGEAIQNLEGVVEVDDETVHVSRTFSRCSTRRVNSPARSRSIGTSPSAWRHSIDRIP